MGFGLRVMSDVFLDRALEAERRLTSTGVYSGRSFEIGVRFLDVSRSNSF